MCSHTPLQTTSASAGHAPLEDWQRAASAVAHRYLELYAATVSRLADDHPTTIRAAVDD
jgi:hypothetical protein